MSHFLLFHLGGDETIFLLSLTELISTNTAKITHCTGVRGAANRNTWNYKFLMETKNESLTERKFEVCVLVFPPLFLIHTPVKLFQNFSLLGLFFLVFSCSGCGVFPKVFAKPLKVHFKSRETLWYPPFTINIFKTESQGEMGMTINKDIAALLYIFHRE